VKRVNEMFYEPLKNSKKYGFKKKLNFIEKNKIKISEAQRKEGRKECHIIQNIFSQLTHTNLK
jgi:hypothetical protein